MRRCDPERPVAGVVRFVIRLCTHTPIITAHQPLPPADGVEHTTAQRGTSDRLARIPVTALPRRIPAELPDVPVVGGALGSRWGPKAGDSPYRGVVGRRTGPVVFW